MFVRHGLYQGGIFRFTVHIPETYPDGDCPVSRTITRILPQTMLLEIKHSLSTLPLQKCMHNTLRVNEN